MQTQRIRSLFLALVLSIASLVMVSTRSTSKIRSVQDFGINDDAECGTIICPEGANLCRISKKNSPDNDEELVVTNTCYSKDNKVLAEDTSRETIGSNQPIYINTNREGGSSQISYIPFQGSSVLSSNSDFDAEELKRKTHLHMQNKINDLHHKMNNMFSRF